jgi:hypothetical protein
MFKMYSRSIALVNLLALSGPLAISELPATGDQVGDATPRTAHRRGCVTRDRAESA